MFYEVKKNYLKNLHYCLIVEPQTMELNFCLLHCLRRDRSEFNFPKKNNFLDCWFGEREMNDVSKPSVRADELLCILFIARVICFSWVRQQIDIMTYVIDPKLCTCWHFCKCLPQRGYQYCFYWYISMMFGIMVRVFNNGLGGLGSIIGRGIPKT